jgi:glyceraldehyde 3-phosphate dehydrogenase
MRGITSVVKSNLFGISKMTIKIGINGFGRIGRLIVRQIHALGLADKLEIVAINDLTDPKTLAHLFKYDSIHRTFPGTVEQIEGGFSINGKSVKILSERDPAKLPWKELGVEIALECTGIFTSKEKAGLHLQAGAKKVVISAPANDADVTLVLGVNQSKYDPANHNIISNGSCTTNCLAPMAKVLVDTFGIERASMTTIHSYTNDQSILDLPHKDLRRARAAAMSMIPTSTGAAKALGLVIPELAGKCDGFAVRVPTPDVSLVDFVAELSKDVTKEEINSALKSASEGSMKGFLGFSDEPLVSSDYIGNGHSSIIDAQSTMVIGKRLAKVVSWYDNEVGFSTRMVDLCQLIAAKM